MGSFPPRIVPPSKITEYLMDPRHVVGGPKEKFFRRHGFSLERTDEMATALSDHPDHNAVETVVADTWGTRYVVRCSVETPDGRNPCVRTVWIVCADADIARLVTADPA